MPYVIIGVGIVIIIAAVVYNILRSRKINANGIEAEAVVSRIETDTDTDADGHTSTRETYYVTYQNQEGRAIEAKLGNPPAHSYVGTSLKVKYLPEKPKYVRYVK